MMELKPCPFCGGEAEIMTSPDGFTSIGCLDCNPVFGVMVQRMTREEAVELWNTRAERTCHWDYPQNINGWAGHFVCSSCGHQFSGVGDWTWEYCPNCGAKVVS